MAAAVLLLSSVCVLKQFVDVSLFLDLIEYIVTCKHRVQLMYKSARRGTLLLSEMPSLFASDDNRQLLGSTQNLGGQGSWLSTKAGIPCG